ncbi:ATP-sensitive inward rectifier potassium channel 10 [Trichoplax sp. H2]|nr:ATP-sensitive inward rectifier potassium channel 10 [Trichoplax sp. H2]|eukprot:RDD45607.1 ATP-sensitive inward rectifier potassium channel 10 [Trichoplax sp. H2]
MVLDAISENQTESTFQRRNSWPLIEVQQQDNYNQEGNLCRLTTKQRRILRDFRRLSQAVVSIPKKDSLKKSYQSIHYVAARVGGIAKKCIGFLFQYVWDIVSADYAYISERADLEGSSAMDSSLANLLKNVRYENYQLRLGDDLYGNIVRMPWSYIFSLIAAAYLAVSIIFTFAYFVADILDLDLSSSIWQWFVYSLSTTTCLGSDSLDSDRVHLFILLIANSQAFVSQLLLAFVTGIVFARFSRGRSQIRFADKLTINPVNGIDCLQGRLTPCRPRFGVIDCNLRLFVSRPYQSKEGEHGVRTKQVPLLTETLPAMSIMLKFTHRLDESSEIRQAMELGEDYYLSITITGVDACTLNPIFDVRRYKANDIIKNYRFIDMIEKVKPEPGLSLCHSKTVIDFNKLNKVTPIKEPSESDDKDKMD